MKKGEKRPYGGLPADEKLFMDIVRLAPDIIVGLDKDQKIRIFNEFAEKITGYKAGEVIGKAWADVFIDKRRRKEIREVWDRVVRGRLVDYHHENSIIAKNGGERLISWHNSLIGEGESWLVLSVGEDITDDKRSEEALLESERKFRLIFENASEIIIYVDKSGKIVDINNRIEDILGYRREDVIGKNFARAGILQVKDIPKMARIFIESVRKKGVIGEGQSHIMEIELRHKNGSVVPLESSTRAILKNGEIVGFLNVLRDITERKKAERMKADAERHFRELFAEMPDAVIILDRKGTFLEVSNEAERMSGYAKDELLGKNLFMTGILDAKAKAIAVRRLALHFSGEKIPPFEMEMRGKDGRVIPLEVNPKIIDYMGKKADIIVIRDITERRRMGKELEESEKRFSNLAENSLTWIWEVDVAGKYTFSSPVAEKILGYTPEEMLRKHFYDLFVPEDREKLKKAAFEAFAKKEPFRDFINRNVRRNGTIAWFSTSGMPILDDNGRLTGYRSMDTNITGRREMEESLKESEERHRFLVDNIDEIVLIISRSGNIIFANKKAEKTFGYSMDELKDKSITGFLTKTSIARAMYALAQEFLGKPQPEMEIEAKTKSGEIRILEVAPASIPVYEKGKLIGIQVNCSDVTERKKMEEEKRRSEETLRKRTEESERFSRLSVGRELKMVELKKRIRELEGGSKPR